MIYIVNKRRKIERIEAEYPNAYILDLTSKSIYAQKLSPFYPHGNIPIPFSKGATATCVEAVWQGLKVFENEGVSMETFKNATMHNLKRTVRKLGKPLGHQKGLYSNELLDYFEARKNIYLPTYKWMFENIPAQVRKSVDSPPGMLTEDHHHTVHEESQVCYSSHLRPKSLHL